MEANLKTLEFDKGLRRNVKVVGIANTGLEFFDSLSQELVDTAYVQNHARMWFASTRIFTLNLPLGLGDDFFFAIFAGRRSGLQHIRLAVGCWLA